MPLSPEPALAYEILAPIGAGGMREVYRARDTKLCDGLTGRRILQAYVEADAGVGLSKTQASPFPLCDFASSSGARFQMVRTEQSPTRHPSRPPFSTTVWRV
jgi:hypothetical protein